jgi:hypothetical protein
MPNWCSNKVTIQTNDEELFARLKAAVTKCEKEGFFSEFIPIPEEEKDNWYFWCIANWGTKWDTGVFLVEEDEDSVQLSFDTAWGPPVKFYESLEELGYVVNAMYFEPGMAFAGIWEDGSDNSYDYSSMSADEVEQYLPEELDEAFYISGYVRDSEEENQEEEDDDDEEEDEEE